MAYKGYTYGYGQIEGGENNGRVDRMIISKHGTVVAEFPIDDKYNGHDATYIDVRFVDWVNDKENEETKYQPTGFELRSQALALACSVIDHESGWAHLKIVIEKFETYLTTGKFPE